MAKAKRTFIKGEAISVTTSVATVASLLDGAAFNASSNVVGLFNCDEAETLYVAQQGTAPSGVDEMIPVQPGQGIEFYANADDAGALYVAGSASLTARVHQEYEPARP